MINVLIVAQAIKQWYVDTLTNALGTDVRIDIITGSKIKGHVIQSPPHDPRSLKSRLICWIKHYVFVSKWVKNNKDKDYDLIFILSNPPINPIVGLKLKKIFKAPLVFMNWDIYPQVIELGIHNPIAKIFSKLWSIWNNTNYHKIDKMLTIGDVMAETINKGLKSPLPIEVLPIPVDINYLKPIDKKSNIFVKEHKLEDKFVVLYSGKMGLGHNIELILETSLKLKDFKDIMFVFIGKGPKYKVIGDFIKKYNTQNILLLPLQPDEIFPYSMACGDIGIVSQEASMAHLFMPSKTFSMMASGMAIIGISSKHDDLKNLIENYEIGYAVSDNSPVTLALYIEDLYKNKDKLEKMKYISRKVVEDKYSIEIIERRYEKLFKDVLKN